MSASLTAANTIRMTEIVKIREESPTVKTFIMTDKLCCKAKPGQFLMLWIPGVDEIPLSIMDVKQRAGFGVCEAGWRRNKALRSYDGGETVGIRDLSVTVSRKAEAESFWLAVEQVRCLCCFWQSSLS